MLSREADGGWVMNAVSEYVERESPHTCCVSTFGVTAVAAQDVTGCCTLLHTTTRNTAECHQQLHDQDVQLTISLSASLGFCLTAPMSMIAMGKARLARGLLAKPLRIAGERLL